MAIDKNLLNLIKQALATTKKAEESPVTAYPRVKFGPPSANSPLSGKGKLNLLNSSTRAIEPLGKTQNFPKSFGSIQPDNLRVPEQFANTVQGSSAVNQTADAVYGADSYSQNKPYLQKAFERVSGFNFPTSQDPLGSPRAGIYKSVNKDILSRPQNDRVRQTYEQELENMRRYGFNNRLSGNLSFITGPTGSPSALPHTSPSEAPTDVSQLSPAMIMPSNFGKWREQVIKQAPSATGMNADSAMLHELEHTNQMSPTGFKGRQYGKYNMEIPAVSSEIAHVAEAYRAATGQYPKGNVLGLPYGNLAQMAIKGNHLYGNKPMSEVLNQPENRKWLDQYTQQAENQAYLEDRIDRGVKTLSNVGGPVNKALATAAYTGMPGLSTMLNTPYVLKAKINEAKATAELNDRARRIRDKEIYGNSSPMPNFNPNYGALQQPGGFDTEADLNERKEWTRKYREKQLYGNSSPMPNFNPNYGALQQFDTNQDIQNRRYSSHNKMPNFNPNYGSLQRESGGLDDEFQASMRKINNDIKNLGK